MEESEVLNNKIDDIAKLKKAETELKETEKHYRIFAAYQHAISELRKFYTIDATFEQMIQKTLDLIIEKFGYYMAWYAELIEEEKVIFPKLWAGKYEKYLDGLRLEYENDKRDAKCAMSLAILTKKPFGYADLEHDKDFEKWRAFALKYGYRSNQAIPLIIDDKCKSAFLIYSTRPFAFSEKLIEYLKGVVDELATIIGNIIERKQAEEALRKAHDELEVRVIERTTELVEINEVLKVEIAEHKKAEEALRESEDKFKKLAEQSPNIICIMKSNKILYVNKRVEEITGYKKEIFYHPNFNFLTVAAPEYIETAKKNITTCMEGRNIPPHEFAVIDKEGKKIEMINSIKSIIFEKEKALLIVATDMTELKKTEENLKKSESELKKQKLALEQKNIALREIVGQIEIEKNKIKENITINVKELLLPLLEKLKMKQSSRKYVDLLQHHIEELTSSFGYKITKKSVKLTSREIEICKMIKGGLSTKEISKLLSLSTQTIGTHRKNIRKKFGLDNKDINLVSYLYQL